MSSCPAQRPDPASPRHQLRPGNRVRLRAGRGRRPQALHVNRLLENPRLVERFQILCIPGGFSYGDDVAAGRILANQIRASPGRPAGRVQGRRQADPGHLQRLPGDDQVGHPARRRRRSWARPPRSPGTTRASTKTAGCGWASAARQCVFLAGIERMYLPVAHAEGKFVTRDAAVLEQLDAAGQLVLRYLPLTAGRRRAAVAAAVSRQSQRLDGRRGRACATRRGRVLGLMPHPERHIDPTQHPALDPRRGRPGRRRTAVVRQRGGVLPVI